MSNGGGSYCRKKKEKEDEEEEVVVEEYRKARDRDALEEELSERTREIVCQRAKAPGRA